MTDVNKLTDEEIEKVIAEIDSVAANWKDAA